MATFRKRGSSWHVQIRRAEHPTLTRSFKHKADAEAWARKLEAGIDRGEAPGDRRLLKGQKLGDIMVRYQTAVTPNKKGAAQEAHRLRQLIRHQIASTMLSQLTPGLIATFRDERLRAVQGVTVRRDLALLRHVIETARKEWGLPIAVNPVSQIKLPPTPEARKRRMIGDEMGRLLSACRERGNTLLEAAIILATETGMRRGELLNVRWSDINLQSRTLHIPISKTGRSRTIPLTRLAGDTISSLPTTAERLIPLTPNALRLAWERLRRKVGIVGLRFHDLRHEAASRFFERGLNVAEVAAITGHQDYRQLARYVHPRPEDIAAKLG